jgi:hypothetical protein
VAAATSAAGIISTRGRQQWVMSVVFAEHATSAYPPTPTVNAPVRANALHLLVELKRRLVGRQ